MFCVKDVKEDVAPPLVGMPGQFPVYLHLPYQRDNYFCFPQEAKQAKFISVLSDCIRHQNQGNTTASYVSHMLERQNHIPASLALERLLSNVFMSVIYPPSRLLKEDYI